MSEGILDPFISGHCKYDIVWDDLSLQDSPDFTSGELLKFLKDARQKLDIVVRNHEGANYKKNFLCGTCTYPNGFCLEIRDNIFNILKKHEEVLALSDGVTFKPIHASWKNGSYNAIQLGGLLLNVAADTGEETEEPVCVSTLQESGFSSFDNFEAYADARSDKYDVIPNVYFPAIAHVYPFFLASKQHPDFFKIFLEDCPMLGYNMDQKGSLADRFLRSSEYSNNRLSVKQRDLMLSKLKGSKVEQFFDEENIFPLEVFQRKSFFNETEDLEIRTEAFKDFARLSLVAGKVNKQLLSS